MEPLANRRLHVLSVYGSVSDTNVPLEAFLAGNEPVRRSILVFGQPARQAEAYLTAARSHHPSLAVWCVEARRQPLRGIVRIIRALRVDPPDVIHVHHTVPAFVVALLGRLFTRAKTVLTLHTDMRRLRLWQRWVYRATMRACHVVVCNSESTRQSVLRREGRVAASPLRVCYNGVSLRAIEARRSSAGWSRAFVVGTACRFVAAKDLPTLLHGFARFREQRPQCRLMIAGDGEQRLELEALSRSLALDPQRIFLGAMSREDVYDLLWTMDVFVVSSLREGFCNAMVEAMASRRAVVASDIPVLREILGTDAGLFFSAGDADGLARALVTLYDDAELRHRLGSAAYTRAVERYSLDACARSYAELYTELVNSSRAIEPCVRS